MRIVRSAARVGAAAVLSASLLTLFALGLGPRTGAYRTVSVLSGSMAPAIPTGALVVVRPVPSGQVRAGDIITFNAPTPDRHVVTHRVVEVVEPGAHPVLRTKGDANRSSDAWAARISESHVWRVWAVFPGVGRAVGFLRTPAMRGASLFAAPALLALVWLAGIWRPERTEPVSHA